MGLIPFVLLREAFTLLPEPEDMSVHEIRPPFPFQGQVTQVR